MAQKGYVLFILDNRGSENRGKAFEQVESVRPDQCANDQIAEHRRQIHAPKEDDRHH